MSEQPPIQPADEPPAWDREAARARYRRLMRSKPMIASYILLIVVILFSWVWGIAATVAPSVENLPGHDVTVPVAACVECHTVNAVAANAPPMNHPRAPSCGFCHRQSFPDTPPATSHDDGWQIVVLPPTPLSYAVH
jgi:hypothetical protein